MRGRAALLFIAAATVALVPGTEAAAQREPEVVVAAAAFPTNMAFAPDGRLFYVEKDAGNIRVVQDGQLLPTPFATLPVQGASESGLLGLALPPDFATNPFLYVYFTSSQDGRNHIARIRADAGDPNRGGPPENLLTLLQASGIHNGGDILFGPDGKLYAVVGETGDETLAQDRSSLGGKVLRLNPDGSIPSDNPFGADSPVYSYGHRNSFGLCVNPHNGDLWETENGPGSDDEVNRIVAGGNYGWPEHLGMTGDDRLEDPALVFQTVIVPTGCAFYDEAMSSSDPRPSPGGQLVFGDFHGDLHAVTLRPPDLTRASEITTEMHFTGGITDVEVGPDGDLYVATSDTIVRMAPGTATRVGPPSTVPTAQPGTDLRVDNARAVVARIVGVAIALVGAVGLLWALRRRRA